MALLFIIVGAVFDFLDGMSARLLRVSSPIGKELDSLADVVTFGVAPSAMLFRFLHDTPAPHAVHLPFVPFLAFVMAAFSALRLAKFNLDKRQAVDFIGLPTPANALFWGGLLAGMSDSCGQWAATAPPSALCGGAHTFTTYILLALMALSCALLVCEMPMFSLKFKTWGWRGNEVRYFFLLLCVPLVGFLGTTGLAAAVACYVAVAAVCSLGRRSASGTVNP